MLILAQDEGRFGRIDQPRRCWAPKPVRPTVPCQIGREFVYVFAAVCASLGRLTSLILPLANTEMMSLFWPLSPRSLQATSSSCSSTEPAGTWPSG